MQVRFLDIYLYGHNIDFFSSKLAMLSKLDESVGRVIKALDNVQMLDNSIILFYSDNGAPSLGFLSNTGSNWPLRGVFYSKHIYFKYILVLFSFHLSKKCLLGRVVYEWLVRYGVPY